MEDTPEIGCYGDGAFGHQHTREACAGVLTFFVGMTDSPDIRPGYTAAQCVEDLRGEMSDDADEEYAACDWLNEHVEVDGALWGWEDGDFGLWPYDLE